MKKFTMFAILFALASVAFGQITVPAPAHDSRRAARALASQKPTEWFAGYIACDLLQPDGTKVWADYRFKAKYYQVGRDFVLKPYYFSKSVDHVLYDNENKPLEVIPYPIGGTPINLYAYLSGYDADGYATLEGELNAANWLSRQPFIFKTRPGRQPVFVAFNLEGRAPESVGLVMEEWGPYSYGYNEQRGGFWLWIDPTTVYHYTIVDLTNHNAVIVPRLMLP
ncbi:MAG: hypothetical protein NTY66_01160 [Candidatus Vogelbacteria bacterium]|nr:hypothetical protein [Candidatus Vogelbacteria bacterium]